VRTNTSVGQPYLYRYFFCQIDKPIVFLYTFDVINLTPYSGQL